VITSGLLGISLSLADARVSGRKATTKQTEVVLFEQAQTALIKADFAEARILLTNLIDTYPDSGYVASVKFFIADSWYSEHAFKQAELEYQDFITFFPNRPEVAETQRRINSIHRNTSFRVRSVHPIIDQTKAVTLQHRKARLSRVRLLVHLSCSRLRLTLDRVAPNIE
jgi:hypothetical protein